MQCFLHKNRKLKPPLHSLTNYHQRSFQEQLVSLLVGRYSGKKNPNPQIQYLTGFPTCSDLQFFSKITLQNNSTNTGSHLLILPIHEGKVLKIVWDDISWRLQLQL